MLKLTAKNDMQGREITGQSDCFPVFYICLNVSTFSADLIFDIIITGIMENIKCFVNSFHMCQMESKF